MRTLRLPAAERLAGFEPVEYGYDREAAMAEARRCLACDLRDCEVEVNSTVCKGCTCCKEVCSLGVFQVADTFNSLGYKPVVVKDGEKCVGCLKCFYTCPDFTITVCCS